MHAAGWRPKEKSMKKWHASCQPGSLFLQNTIKDYFAWHGLPFIVASLHGKGQGLNTQGTCNNKQGFSFSGVWVYIYKDAEK